MSTKSMTSLAELDTWISENVRVDSQGRKYLMSRYSALKELYGEKVAIWTLQELSIKGL